MEITLTHQGKTLYKGTVEDFNRSFQEFMGYSQVTELERIYALRKLENYLNSFSDLKDNH